MAANQGILTQAKLGDYGWIGQIQNIINRDSNLIGSSVACRKTRRFDATGAQTLGNFGDRSRFFNREIKSAKLLRRIVTTTNPDAASD
jgi:hypothetical protein